jgi:hypothetical protein
MYQTWHALEMLASRSRIECSLLKLGMEINGDCRDLIDQALREFIDSALLDFEDAEARIIAAFTDQVRMAA